jgi:phosphatidylglycerophosphatase A
MSEPSSTPWGTRPQTVAPLAASRATSRFMMKHPARWIALGLGSGLSPWAPGTVGTLWAWVAFLVLDPWLRASDWAVCIGLSLWVGWWACTRCAQDLGVADPSAIVWDEVVAFWLVLWLWMPASLGGQVLAFALFRFFDAVKPGPVAWADRLFKGHRGSPIGWAQGFGIMWDDLVAAFCTLLVLSLGMALVGVA